MPVPMKSSVISLSRTGVLFKRYSLSPERYRRLVTVISSYSIGSILSWLERVRETSAKLTGSLPSVPLNITSSILPPRRTLADCSPRAHFILSAILDLPHPFGPTIAVMPGSKSSLVLSAKDLKPNNSIDLKYICILN